MIRLNIAWMVDYNGKAVAVENHMQSGEIGENLLDEYAVITAYEYGNISNRTRYCKEARIVALYILTLPYSADDWYNMIEKNTYFDFQEEVKKIIEPCNQRKFLEVLRLSEFKMSASKALDILYEVGLDPEDQNPPRLKEAFDSLTALFQQDMMRVRAGGLTNSLVRGAKELYFRIPDTTPEKWYQGISTFIWDHPQYAGFEMFIYSDINGNKQLIKKYASCKEYLDLHSSRQVSSVKIRKLNNCYRRTSYYYKLFKTMIDDLRGQLR